ncbi:unnamed protein product [Allacma fusca]|uniref:Uncharacterized protein n=1 Tax=Allacma fusca TaxID=39272 RepID=A0A8J2KTW5_9HEXA|nr:unnamed protein product [Allacma fusca]
MYSENFHLFIKIAFKIISVLRASPFSYNYRSDVLQVRASSPMDLKNGIFLLNIVTFYIFTGHYILKFVLLKNDLELNLGDTCYHIFLLICWIGFLFYPKNLLANQNGICWLYNQLAKQNHLHGISRKKSTMLEKIMMSWLISQLNAIFSTVSGSILFPNRQYFIFSYFLEWNYNILLHAVCSIMESYSMLCACCTCISEYYFHASCIRSLIFWAEQNTIQSTIRIKRGKVIDHHNQLQILTQEFTNCFGWNIELLKSMFTLGAVTLSFALIRYHKYFDPSSIGFVLTCWSIVVTNPPILYSHAYIVHESSLTTIKNLRWVLSSVRFLPERKYISRKIMGLKPLKIRAANMYFLDRTMLPIFIHVVMNYTLSLLIVYH